MHKSILSILFVAFLLASCAGSKHKKDFTYFKNLPKDSAFIVENLQPLHELKLKTDDVITVRISTMDEKSNTLFNQGVLKSIEEGGGASADILQTDGYRVDNLGNINFPVFGKIKVADKTLEEVEKLLTEKIATQVKSPIVNVRLKNAQVTVMGEVGRSGLVELKDRKATVLEVIGMAGDIMPTGRKDNVLIIRTSKGRREYIRLNLNDVNVYTSPYYYVQQDDVIVVEPNDRQERIVSGKMTSVENSRLVLSLLGSTMSIITFAFIMIDRANR